MVLSSEYSFLHVCKLTSGSETGCWNFLPSALGYTLPHISGVIETAGVLIDIFPEHPGRAQKRYG